MTLTVGGGAQTVNVQIKNTGDTPQLTPVKLTIDIPSDLGLTISSKPGGCDGSGTHLTCTVDGPLAKDATKNLPVGIAPPAQSSIPAGQSKKGSGQVIITDGGSDTKGFNATLNAQAAAPTTQAAPTTVTEVSGTITDSQTGKGISGATVVLADGSGKETQITSGSSGSFKFTGSENKPIAPGAMTITVGAGGYENSSPKSVTGTAGKATTGVKIGLVVLADTASAAPLPSANDGAFADGQSAGGVVPQNTATNNASNNSGGGVSWILIALGVLLVGFGIVAIVLLLRRRGDDDDEPEDEPAPRRGAPGVRPGYGGPQAAPTMVGAMGPAPTMINRGGNNDATAIVRPGQVFDDVPPDPYGAPMPGPGGYPSAGGYDDRAGFASGGYNGGGANGYGGQQARPAPGPAVDPYAPDYNGGGGGGYADSTQRYEPGGNGYGGGNNGYNNNPATGGNNYGGGQGGYGGNNGYDGGAQGGYDGGAQGGGYGGGQRDRGGYEGPPTTIGGFGGGDHGGYDGPAAGGGYGPGGDRGGYGPGNNGGGGGGYDDRGGYGPGGGDRGGYDGPSAGGGYNPGGDRGGYGPNGGGGSGGGGNNGYDDRGGYGPGNGGGGGYDDRGGYDGPSAGGGYNPGGDRGGYGPNGGGGGGGGYDDQPYAGRGGYGPSDRGGYEPASGYERDGYERVPEPPRAGNGYGPNGGGGGGGGEYDQRGGYGPNNNNGGNRRSLDWLDD
ncbi:carboxypeptidase-like regulatory domain-containing protein [Dactylosporangium sp. NPDC000244]|uniref:carboxypeptidase-like regulatory domain-containing protein n=1 Tax=Dactylosporangium sp. NPDC000244 TaxID=3154365 RepID=UPI003317101C